MNKKIFGAESFTGKVLIIAVGLLLFTLVSAFADSKYGKLERSRDLQKQIESYQVLPDHNYYYSGGHARPNAIIGIHMDYQLVHGQWQSIQISSGQLQKWITSISPDTSMGPKGYYGAYIIAPDGKKAGFWYSIQSSTSIKFPGGNKIEVYTPDLNQPGELEEMITPEEPEIDMEIEAPDMDMGGGMDD